MTELAYERARAEKAERREEMFRNWWAGVSKRLRDLQHQMVREDWARAENCDTHGETIKDLDGQVRFWKQLAERREKDRIALVVGMQTLLEIDDAHRKKQLRDDLTIDDLVKAVGSIARRCLDGKAPEAKKRARTEPQALFDIDRSAA